MISDERQPDAAVEFTYSLTLFCDFWEIVIEVPKMVLITAKDIVKYRCITWGSNPPATLSWSRTNGRRSTTKHLKVKLVRKKNCFRRITVAGCE